MGILQRVLDSIFGEPAAASVDVERVLQQRAEQHPERAHLEWETSVVDLLKLLDLPSDLEARQELAQELDVEFDDNAEMNRKLHAAVMEALAENGGQVPDHWREALKD